MNYATISKVYSHKKHIIHGIPYVRLLSGVAPLKLRNHRSGGGRKDQGAVPLGAGCANEALPGLHLLARLHQHGAAGKVRAQNSAAAFCPDAVQCLSLIHISRRIALSGLLFALAMALSFIEGTLTIPGLLPGMKLGLANIVVCLLYTSRCV